MTILGKLSTHADGVLPLHLRTLNSGARIPIDMSRHFLAHMSAKSPLNITPNTSGVIPEVSENPPFVRLL